MVTFGAWQFQNDLSDPAAAEGCVEYGDSDGRVFFTDYAAGVPGMLIVLKASAAACEHTQLIGSWQTFRELRSTLGLDEAHFQRALSCSAEYRMKMTEGLSYCNFYFMDVRVSCAPARRLIGATVLGSVIHAEGDTPRGGGATQDNAA